MQDRINRRDFFKVASAGAISGTAGVAAGSQAGLQSGAPALRFRQVHLDFHTSEHIQGVGSQFDPDEFAETLKRAHVNSVTCFGRCHHGWIYYDTKAFPERRHPHLTRNLLKEQIEACHKRNIRVPIYITVQWDHFTADRHPEWLVLDEKGAPIGTPIYEPGFYRSLCVNTPYRQFVKENIKEVLETLPVDGIFFDIVKPQECNCRYCRKGMIDGGMDPTNPANRRKFALDLVNQFKREMTAYVRQFNKDATIFYNAGHVGTRHRAVVDAYTHFELESLPSGGWGYLHFPLVVRYTRHLGVDNLGMTGKFHTSWADFHSYKNRAALEFECFQMLALGAKCSVGDQLHPLGKMDAAAYDLIGSVYAEVEKKEQWCEGARPVTEIGVVTPEEFLPTEVRTPPPALGAVRMFQELAYQFDVLDSKSDFSRYKVLVLPDEIPVSKELAAKIDGFVEKGGSLLASFESGLNESKDDFALKSLGVKLKGDAPYSPDFVLPKGKMGEGLPATEHVMYLKGKEVEALPGAEVLVPVVVPFFNRTWERFCSHRHTPSAGKTAYPGVVRKGRTIYFAHPIFTQYHRNAPRWCKLLVRNAISALLPEPVLRLEAPSSTLAALNEQPQRNRWVLHLLHYIPERRGQDFDVIEDVIPVLDVRVSLAPPRRIKEVLLVPEQRPLRFETRGERVEFVLPRLDGHQMISLTFA